MATTDIDLGLVTAYGYAISKGYTGTEEQFKTDLANIANKQDKIPSTAVSDVSSSALQVVGNQKIDYNALAKAIVEQYSASKLCGSAQSVKSAIDGLNNTLIKRGSHIRQDVTSKVSALKTAIASGYPEQYGFGEGDYLTGASGYTYILADYDHWYGGYNNYGAIATRHWGVLVNTHTTHAWNASGKTTGGYVASDLHAYLTGDVLTNVKSDMSKLGLSLTTNNKLYSTAVNETGHNRYGSASGCSSSWAWSTGETICAPTEIEIYGSIAWSSSGYDTGEACKPLAACQMYRFNELFGNTWLWLRDITSSSNAALANDAGNAHYDSVTAANRVVGLIGIY